MLFVRWDFRQRSKRHRKPHRAHPSQRTRRVGHPAERISFLSVGCQVTFRPQSCAPNIGVVSGISGGCFRYSENMDTRGRSPTFPNERRKPPSIPLNPDLAVRTKRATRNLTIKTPFTGLHETQPWEQMARRCVFLRLAVITQVSVLNRHDDVFHMEHCDGSRNVGANLPET